MLLMIGMITQSLMIIALILYLKTKSFHWIKVSFDVAVVGGVSAQCEM